MATDITKTRSGFIRPPIKGRDQNCVERLRGIPDLSIISEIE
jgi:hypothetical protein